VHLFGFYCKNKTKKPIVRNISSPVRLRAMCVQNSRS